MKKNLKIKDFDKKQVQLVNKQQQKQVKGGGDYIVIEDIFL